MLFCQDPEVRRRVLTEIFAMGMDLGGAISGEHGIGRAKASYFTELEDPAKLALLRRIKDSFDPGRHPEPGRDAAGLAAAVGVQRRAQCLQRLGADRWEGRSSRAFGGHQAGLAQLGEVMAHRGLGQIERRGQLSRGLLPRSRAEQVRHDLDRAGSASALSRSATCRASVVAHRPAATGAQHTGAVVSMTGRALGMKTSMHEGLTYIEKVAHRDSRIVRHMSQTLGGVPMSRVKLALNVDDLDTAIAFYSKLFGAERPR